MKYLKGINILSIWVMFMGILSLSGCVKTAEPAPADIGHSLNTEYICGGTTQNTDYNAPKKIESDKLRSFSAKFFLYDESGSEGDYWFEVKPNEEGKLILSEQCAYHVSCETNAALLSALQKIIVKYELVKMNGTDKYTNGLPPAYQPSFLSAAYESGERLCFCTNNDPDAAWTREVLQLLGDEFASHGENRFTDKNPHSEEDAVFPDEEASSAEPGETEAFLLKDRPEEGDLIRGQRFYAQLPKNRYGGNCEEGDYAEGRFIIWVNRVTLSESGEIIRRDRLAVPYIIGDHGNAENLSMLSGGPDGDHPYGDEIWEITTNENGEIIDAVFYK